MSPRWRSLLVESGILQVKRKVSYRVSSHVRVAKLTTKTCHRAIRSHFPTCPFMLAASRISLKCCASSGPLELRPIENHPTISLRFMFRFVYTEIINVTSLSWNRATWKWHMIRQRQIRKFSSLFAQRELKWNLFFEKKRREKSRWIKLRKNFPPHWPERWMSPWTGDSFVHALSTSSSVQSPDPCCWRGKASHTYRVLCPAKDAESDFPSQSQPSIDPWCRCSRSRQAARVRRHAAASMSLIPCCRILRETTNRLTMRSTGWRKMFSSLSCSIILSNWVHSPLNWSAALMATTNSSPTRGRLSQS